MYTRAYACVRARVNARAREGGEFPRKFSNWVVRADHPDHVVFSMGYVGATLSCTLSEIAGEVCELRLKLWFCWVFDPYARGGEV